MTAVTAGPLRPNTVSGTATPNTPNSVAVIALGEPVRAARFLNVALGAWIVASPFVLGGASPASMLNAVVVGTALVALSVPRGPVCERYGGWSRYVV